MRNSDLSVDCVYDSLSAHGFLFRILYAPAQALLFGLSFQGMILDICGISV